MDRYKKLFDNLKSTEAIIPFVTLGDPDYKTSKEIIRALIKGGASALELGLPFSDPVADGPVIQRANIRALKSKVYTDDAFKIISEIRNQYPDIPIGILSYLNLAYGYGVDSFFKKLKEIGVDSVLFADLPILMLGKIDPYAKKHQIKRVLIAPPNASEDQIKTIANLSEGYVYLLGRSGVTGTDIRTDESENIKRNIELLRKYNSPPILQGFGIKNRADIQTSMKIGIDGVFVGSSIVRLIEDNLHIIKKEKFYLDIEKKMHNLKCAEDN